MVPINPNGTSSPNSGANWRACWLKGGSPFADDPTPSKDPIFRINEIGAKGCALG